MYCQLKLRNPIIAVTSWYRFLLSFIFDQCSVLLRWNYNLVNGIVHFINYTLFLIPENSRYKRWNRVCWYWFGDRSDEVRVQYYNKARRAGEASRSRPQWLVRQECGLPLHSTSRATNISCANYAPLSMDQLGPNIIHSANQPPCFAVASIPSITPSQV